jgi:hypothetical protein
MTEPMLQDIGFTIWGCVAVVCIAWVLVTGIKEGRF